MEMFSVISWNTCRRPFGCLRTFGKSIKTRGLGSAVMCLQEVPNILHGRYIGKGTFYGGRQSTAPDSIDNNINSTCGIVIPMHLITLVVDFRFGTHWCAMLLRGGIMIISAHFLWGGYDNTEEIISGVAEALLTFRTKYSRLEIIAGFDSNTTLPRNHDGVTGDKICRALRSHSWTSRYKIAEWLQSLGLRALNTFGEGQPEWTCGRFRKSPRPGQMVIPREKD